MKHINIGLIGLGTIGTGVVSILTKNSRLIEDRVGIPVRLAKIADLDIKRDRGIEIDKGILTTNAEEILNDPGIDIVIELIGGDEPAKGFILNALNNGKHVVTANKALLAKSGEEIFGMADRKRTAIGFEASVGGGIPIIRSLREGFVANNIESIYGIVNGTGNYILSKMTDEGGDFSDILKKAQDKGYAEADPTLDIEGIDSAHKIVILALLAFGTRVSLEDVYTEGFSDITQTDISYAREFGCRIKLLAIAKSSGDEIDIRVHPTMIPQDHPISRVNGVFNAIRVTGDFVGENMLIGKGAGSFPTASAVVGDIAEIARDMIRGSEGYRLPSRSYLPERIKDTKIKDISNITSEYYLRFSVLDRPGVLSKISGILGARSISIASVIQKGRRENEAVPLVIMTHSAVERDIQSALSEIDRLDVVLEKTVLIRVEDKGEG